MSRRYFLFVLCAYMCVGVANPPRRKASSTRSSALRSPGTSRQQVRRCIRLQSRSGDGGLSHRTDDILKARIRTMGVEEHLLKMETGQYRISSHPPALVLTSVLLSSPSRTDVGDI